jgi:hypothetical protein
MFWIGLVVLVVGVGAMGAGVVLIVLDVVDQVDDATSGEVGRVVTSTPSSAEETASELGGLITLTIGGSMVMALGIVLMVLGTVGRRLGL